jgi:hypothetical protein
LVGEYGAAPDPGLNCGEGPAPPPIGLTSAVGEYAGDTSAVGEYAGDTSAVGEYAGDTSAVGEYAGDGLGPVAGGVVTGDGPALPDRSVGEYCGLVGEYVGDVGE